MLWNQWTPCHFVRTVGTQTSHAYLATERRIRQAQCCKALIRRLGSEVYDPVFLYEDHVDAAALEKIDGANTKEEDIVDVHTKCVSLR